MKALIVEDEFVSRALLQGFLKDYGAAHVAVNGREAVAAVIMALEAGEPYDLICLDIMMPEMNGHDALVEIRNREKEHGLSLNGSKVIMTTALGDIKNITTAYNGLCDGYLTKPIHREAFIKELRKLKLMI